MKATYTTLLLLFLPFFAMSQMNSSIDFIAGIDYSYRHISANSSELQIPLILDSRNKNERGKFNWRFGINYNHQLSNKIYLKTGLRLASVGYSLIDLDGVKYPNEHNGMGGHDPTIGGDPLSSVSLLEDFLFVEVPIAARYEINTKKLAPFIELGLAPSYYIGTLQTSILDSERTVDHTVGNAQKLNFVGLISFGMNYNYSDTIQAFAQPTIRYHFTKLIDAKINENLYNAGIEIGVRKMI